MKAQSVGLWLLVLAGLGCGPNARPGVPELSGIRNCVQDRQYVYTLRVADADGDSVRSEVVWGDSATPGEAGFVPPGFSVTYDKRWSAPGRYAVRARAWDVRGAGSDWSGDYAVRVYAADSLPMTPSALQGPATGDAWFIQEFTVAVEGPSDEPLRLEVDWRDGDTLRRDLTLDGRETLAVRHVFMNTGLRGVRARLKDRNTGKVSDWSPECVIYVGEPAGSGWSRRYPLGDDVRAVEWKSDGGLVMTGVGGDIAFLTVTDTAGNPGWWKTYEAFDPLGVQSTSDGGFIMVGTHSWSTRAICLLRTDSAGNQMWSREYVLGNSSGAQGLSVRQTADDGFIVAGGTVALKADANGDSVWARAIPANGVELTPEGNYLFCGGTSLLWLDALGNTVRQVRLSEAREKMASIRRAAAGGYLVAGTLASDSGRWASLTRLAESGSVLGRHCFGLEEAYGFNAAPASDGGCFLLGVCRVEAPYGYFHVFLVRTDHDGRPVWRRIIDPWLCAKGNWVVANGSGCFVAGESQDGTATLLYFDAQGRVGRTGAGRSRDFPVSRESSAARRLGD